MMQSLCKASVISQSGSTTNSHGRFQHLFQASDHIFMSVFYKKISRLFRSSSGRAITIFFVLLWIYVFFICLFVLLCTTTIANGVYCGNRSSSMFYEELMVDFIKGWIRRKVLELDTGCLKVLWGVWASDISSSSDSLAIASPPLALNLELNDRVWAVVVNIAPHL